MQDFCVLGRPNLTTDIQISFVFWLLCFGQQFNNKMQFSQSCKSSEKESLRETRQADERRRAKKGVLGRLGGKTEDGKRGAERDGGTAKECHLYFLLSSLLGILSGILIWPLQHIQRASANRWTTHGAFGDRQAMHSMPFRSTSAERLGVAPQESGSGWTKISLSSILMTRLAHLLMCLPAVLLCGFSLFRFQPSTDRAQSRRSGEPSWPFRAKLANQPQLPDSEAAASWKKRACKPSAINRINDLQGHKWWLGCNALRGIYARPLALDGMISPYLSFVPM